MVIQFTFKSGWISESDEWTQSGPSISDESTLLEIKKAFENQRMLVVEHWFYRGGSAPDRLVFDDYDVFEDYLKEKGRAGDAIHIFDITDALKEGKQLVHGKCPNERGEVPKKGAY